eukprot:359834-Chlamydomonas_euryale.AAC.1
MPQRPLARRRRHSLGGASLFLVGIHLTGNMWQHGPCNRAWTCPRPFHLQASLCLPPSLPSWSFLGFSISSAFTLQRLPQEVATGCPGVTSRGKCGNLCKVNADEIENPNEEQDSKKGDVSVHRHHPGVVVEALLGVRDGHFVNHRLHAVLFQADDVDLSVGVVFLPCPPCIHTLSLSPPSLLPLRTAPPPGLHGNPQQREAGVGPVVPRQRAG